MVKDNTEITSIRNKTRNTQHCNKNDSDSPSMLSDCN